MAWVIGFVSMGFKGLGTSESSKKETAFAFLRWVTDAYFTCWSHTLQVCWWGFKDFDVSNLNQLILIPSKHVDISSISLAPMGKGASFHIPSTLIHLACCLQKGKKH